VYIPDTGEQRHILINPEVEVYTAFSPYFAFATRPSRQLRLTSTLHLPSSSNTTGENRARFWTDDLYETGESYVPQTFEFSQGYQPLRASIGMAWLSEALSDGLSALQLGAGATLHRWSTYRDRHGERPPDTWSNTVSANVGGAVAVSERQWASLDLAYFPTPVPDQVGRTNYVDNSRVAASAAFEAPLPWSGLRLGAYLHGQLMIERKVTKRTDARHRVIDEFDDSAVDLVSNEPIAGADGLQTNNPGFPGFSSRGWMLGAGLALRLPQ
jgi:long-chain fatty acid transport protein